MDNVFVIALIFAYFRVQVISASCIVLGILGALLMRGMMIWLGIETHQTGLTGYCTGLACCCCSRGSKCFSRRRNRTREEATCLRLAGRLLPVAKDLTGKIHHAN